MEREIRLESKDFINFLRCLSVLKDICSDADIKGGVLRQRSDDKSVIIEMDLTPLISDCDIPISDLKKDLTLLKGLSKQEVQISITDDEIYFSGKRSTFKFNKAHPSFVNNKFIPSEEFANIFILKERDLVLEHVVTKDVSNLMKVIAGQFKIANFQISFDGNVASITATTSDKKQHSEIEYGISVKKHSKGISNITVRPFLIDHDRDILFKMYNIKEDLFISKSTASIGKIAVDIYCRGVLTEVEDNSTSLKEEEGE